MTLSVNLINQRQSDLKSGDLLYLGDMSNIKHIFKPTDHTKHQKVKQFLGSQYTLLDGSLAYIERFECYCCETEQHHFLAAATNDGKFVGHLCRYCSQIKEITETDLIGYSDIIFRGQDR